MPGHSKKIVNLFFCVFQTKLKKKKKTVNIFCTLPQWIRNVQIILGKNLDQNSENLDQNLACQKTEEIKSNKGNLTFASHTVNMIEP